MTIQLAEKYIPILSEKYKKETVTEILDAPSEIVQESMSGRKVHIPEVELDGLGDYDRADGFSDGSVTVNWVEYELEQDRGTEFLIDEADNMETVEVAFASASEQFMRTQVAPEVDAYRFAEMADSAGTVEEEDFSASDSMIDAIDEAVEELDNEEVPESGRFLFVNPTIYRFMKSSDLIDRTFSVQSGEEEVNRNIGMLENMPVIKVPKGRFDTDIDLDDGSGGGGFATDGDTINFMIVHQDAVLPIVKLDGLRVFSPAEYQEARAYKFDYRIYHDIIVPDNKTAGIYVSHESSQ